MLQDLWLWYNCGLSETTLVISSSQSELNSPRKFLFRDFFLSRLYSLLADTLTQLLTSRGTWLSSVWLVSIVLDLENRENIVCLSAGSTDLTSCPDGALVTTTSECGHSQSPPDSPAGLKSRQWSSGAEWSAKLRSYSSVGGEEREGIRRK